jgi:hypothetical protein
MGVGVGFNVAAAAADMGVTRPEASGFIQAYLDAQRKPKARTLYVLSRQGRTRSAVWHVGARTADARKLTEQCLSDMIVKVTDALAPDLRRMGILNPRTAALTTANVNAFVANLAALAAAVGGTPPPSNGGTP